MRIFLTGGTGFIGRHFLNHVIHEPCRVVAISRSNSLKDFESIETITWLQKEFAEVESKDFVGIDVFVHIASHGVSPQPAELIETFQVNVLDSLKIINNAIKAGVKKFVIIGTCLEYGEGANGYDYIPITATLQPNTIYGSSKAAFFLAISSLCKIHKFSLSYLRLFNVFGESQNEGNFWPQLVYHAEHNIDFKMTDGEQVRDFIHVEEVARILFEECLKEYSFGEPVIKHVGSGNPMKLSEFAEFWWKKIGSDAKLLKGFIPNRENEIMRYVPKLD